MLYTNLPRSLVNTFIRRKAAWTVKSTVEQTPSRNCYQLTRIHVYPVRGDRSNLQIRPHGVPPSRKRHRHTPQIAHRRRHTPEIQPVAIWQSAQIETKRHESRLSLHGNTFVVIVISVSCRVPQIGDDLSSNWYSWLTFNCFYYFI